MGLSTGRIFRTLTPVQGGLVIFFSIPAKISSVLRITNQRAAFVIIKMILGGSSIAAISYPIKR
jgi:hypothetical protein